MRASELAAALALPLEGDPGVELAGAAPLDSAAESDLSFAAHPKAEAQARASSAGCVVALPRYERAQTQTVLRSPQPRLAFARALKLLYPEPEMSAGVHPSATIAGDAHIAPSATVGPYVSIEAGARIGAHTVIHAGASIGAGVRIGERCVIHPRVTIYRRSVIGDRVILHAGSVIGADGFGFEFTGERFEKFPQVGWVEIGNDVEIGANACVDRGALGATLIGEGTKLDNMVHVGHNCRIGRHVVVAAQTGFSGQVSVGDYAIIGGQVGIGDKARIESKAVLGSGCGILTSKIVHAGQVMWGTPARPLREHLEQLANLARLPALRKEVAELRRRIEELAR